MPTTVQAQYQLLLLDQQRGSNATLVQPKLDVHRLQKHLDRQLDSNVSPSIVTTK